MRAGSQVAGSTDFRSFRPSRRVCRRRLRSRNEQRGAWMYRVPVWQADVGVVATLKDCRMPHKTSSTDADALMQTVACAPRKGGSWFP